MHECELERQAAVSRLEEDLADLRQSNERLSLQNRQLQEFKGQVLVQVDEDVFLTLAENLKTEIIKNQRLESQVNIYKDSLKLTHVKYSRLKLALLDKAIKKAKKEKTERDRKEASRTKQEIEKELEDRRLNEEQEEWETRNAGKPLAPVDLQVTEGASVEEDASRAETEVVKESTEARPLPVKVRKAQKRSE